MSSPHPHKDIPPEDQGLDPDRSTSRQERRIAARREHILDAAARVFAQKGFRHATIRDVAAAADVADGTIYNYFENKDDLLNALLNRLAEQEQQPILTSPGLLESEVVQRMRKLHEQYIQVIAVIPEILGTPALRLRYLEQFVIPVCTSLEADIQKTANERGGTSLDVPIAARVLMSAVLGFQVLMILGDPLTQAVWEEPEKLARVWSRFIAFGLRED